MKKIFGLLALVLATSAFGVDVKPVGNPVPNGTLSLFTVNGSNVVQQIGVVTNPGKWTLGLYSATNFNNQPHIINGGLIGGGDNSTQYGSRFYIGTNFNGYGHNSTLRANATKSGGGIAFDNSTAGAPMIQFLANQAADATSTQAAVVGTVTDTGAWTLGPATGNINHQIYGRVRAQSSNTGDGASTAVFGGGTIYKTVANNGTLAVTTASSLGKSTGLLIISNASVGKGCLVFISSSAGIGVLSDGDNIPCSNASGASRLYITSDGAGTVTITNQMGSNQNLAAAFYGL